MAGSGLSFLETFIKSSLDNYILPGTRTGTEILLLYLSHWKRNFHAFVSGVIHLIQADLSVLDAEEDPTGSETLSECPIECPDNTETT